MRTVLIHCIFANCLCAISPAAVHAVLPGTAIQEKVNLAQPGDILAISAGTYPDDVIVNKAVRLVEMDGANVEITGNITFTSVANAPPFEGFTVGSPGKGIHVEGNTALIVKNVTSTSGIGIKSLGASKLTIVGGTYSKIHQDGGEVMASQTEVTGDFETTPNSVKTVAFRMNVTGDYMWRSQKAWCGYSKGWHFRSHGSNGIVVVVACELDGREYYYVGSESGSNSYNSGYFENYAIDIRGTGNKVLASNNNIYGVAYAYVRHANQGYPFIDTIGRGISVDGNHSSIVVSNNYIGMHFAAAHNGNAESHAIYVTASKSQISNNIIQNSFYAIHAPFGADVRSNCLHTVYQAESIGGHVPIQTINTDPLFILNQRPKLQAVSPCINAGTEDPNFNDLDGTRNDIGPGGGCFFDPDGWTTDKPVVISFDLGPAQLLQGQDTQITLSNGQAVGQE